MAEVVVFAGPCFHRLDDAERDRMVAGMELLPPARRGDVIGALRDGLETIVLLDGYFFSELSVAHKELLYALESGVRVIGAASMGALRAVEMAPFGMEGVGEIYRWYAEGVLDGDDEVAVVHLPQERGYAQVTLALVEVRHALNAMVERGACGANAAAALVQEIKRLGFSDRSPERIHGLALRQLGETAANALAESLARFSLKEGDARRALELARRRPHSRTVTGIGQDSDPADRTVFFSHWLAEHGRPPASTSLSTRATLGQAWSVAQLFHAGVPDLVARLRSRFLSASAARRAGLAPDPERLRSVTDSLASRAKRLHGGAVLPQREVSLEAHTQALGELASEAFGGPRAAGDWLAAEHGLDSRDGHAQLIFLVARQYGCMTTWSFVRAFTFTEALRPALELAEAVLEVDRCFLVWSEGGRIEHTDLVQVAAEVWGCSPESVSDVAGTRGLLEADGFSQGLREVLQRVAPAERLPRPINDYPVRKDGLRAASIDYPLELLPQPLPGFRPRFRPRGPRRRYSVPS